MKTSTGNPTKAEQARFGKLKALGCVACRLNGDGWDLDEMVPPDIHHLLSGNKRIGHHATIPLCAWHHAGVGYDGVPCAWFLANIGPSIHKHTRAFRARYGADGELLAMVNELINEDAASGELAA